MDQLKEAIALRAKLAADMKLRLLDKDGGIRAELTDEDRAVIDTLSGKIDDLTPQIDRMSADENRFKRAREIDALIQEPATARIVTPLPSGHADAAERTIPAVARRHSRLKAFANDRGETSQADELEAYRFGTWFAATRNVPWAVQRCRDLGIGIERALTEGTNTAGGFAVPEEFSGRFIALRERYGVFRRNAFIEPMTSDSKSILRQTDGLTAYAIGEMGALTESNLTFDQVNLFAKKFGCITVFSSELAEDAIISIGDKLADNIAQAIAKKEDQCAFVANGQATYHGIVGIGPTLTNLNGVDEGGGIIVATGNLPSEFAIGDWGKVPGLVPAYVDPARCKWYMHKNVYSSGWLRLEIALAGNTWPLVREGEQSPRILGSPVEYVQCMDYCAAGTEMSQVLAIYGDLALAATMGDRRGLTIGMSTEGTVGSVNLFEQDSAAIRGVARFDINVHDVGTATVAGPVVALIGKAN